MKRLFAILFLPLGACTVAGSPPKDPDPPRTIGEPTLYRAEVVSAEGDAPARLGDRCAVEIRRIHHPEFDCRVRVTCAGDLVYGLPDAGYNRCTFVNRRVRQAHDGHGTREDGDPQLVFDLETRTVRISDRDPDMSLVLSLEAPTPKVAVPPPPPGYES